MSALLYKHHKTCSSCLPFNLADLLMPFILFHVLMLVRHWECKRPPLNDTGKDQKLTTDFEKILTFSLARGFDLVLSLGVTTPLITPVMGIS